MPYIAKEDRDRLEIDPEGVCDEPQTPGELNFVITDVIDTYLLNRHHLSYQALNEVVGVLECAKLELYRRVAAPYEDKKCVENGDVYNVPATSPGAAVVTMVGDISSDVKTQLRALVAEYWHKMLQQHAMKEVT